MSWSRSRGTTPRCAPAARTAPSSRSASASAWPVGPVDDRPRTADPGVMRGGRAALALVGLLVTTPARAQDATEGAAPEEVLPEEPGDTPPLDVHGFVSQGAFISTDNDYLGHSKR